MTTFARLVFRRTFRKLVLNRIVSLAFVVGGVFVLFRSPDKWVGWMAIILFGSCALTSFLPKPDISMGHIDIAAAHKRFARSLLGTWRSHTSQYPVGMDLTFHDDGTGTMQEWGFDHFYLNPDYVSVPDFQWSSVADHTIKITYRGKTLEVKYDFKTCKNQYGGMELRVFEVGREPDEYGCFGFWLSPFSLAYCGRDRNAPFSWRRLWKKPAG